MGHRQRRRAGPRTLLLLAAMLAALSGCGAIQPYDGPPSYGNFRGTHGA